MTEDEGIKVSDDDGAEVAAVNTEGIELKKKQAAGSATGVRSIKLTKEGSFKSYDETGAIEKVTIDKETVSIKDDTGAETVAITKDAMKLKKPDGYGDQGSDDPWDKSAKRRRIVKQLEENISAHQKLLKELQELD